MIAVDFLVAVRGDGENVAVLQHDGIAVDKVGHAGSVRQIFVFIAVELCVVEHLGRFPVHKIFTVCIVDVRTVGRILEKENVAAVRLLLEAGVLRLVIARRAGGFLRQLDIAARIAFEAGERPGFGIGVLGDGIQVVG